MNLSLVTNIQNDSRLWLVDTWMRLFQREAGWLLSCSPPLPPLYLDPNQYGLQLSSHFEYPTHLSQQLGQGWSLRVMLHRSWLGQMVTLVPKPVESTSQNCVTNCDEKMAITISKVIATWPMRHRKGGRRWATQSQGIQFSRDQVASCNSHSHQSGWL